MSSRTDVPVPDTFGEGSIQFTFRIPPAGMRKLTSTKGGNEPGYFTLIKKNYHNFMVCIENHLFSELKNYNGVLIAAKFLHQLR